MAQYVTKPIIVAQCLSILRAARIHPNFAGYLCLKRTSAANSSEQDLQANFKGFFETFLRVPDAPKGKPYLLPFTNKAPSNANAWFNENVAGSYAPSSIRPGKPFASVVDVKSVRRTPFYTLKNNHWEMARAYLTNGNPIPVVELAVFLYRDFAIETENPSTKDLVDIFRDEFGYLADISMSAETEFQHLYFDDSQNDSHSEWFELIS